MSEPDATAPTKVCPHCSVQSTTSSASCPACGRPYRRRGLSARTLALVLVPVAAVAAVAVVLIAGGGDEDPAPRAGKTAPAAEEEHVLSIEQARKMPLNILERSVVEQYGPPQPRSELAPDQPVNAIKDLRCVYYNFEDTPDGDIRLCYDRKTRLRAVTTVYPRSQAGGAAGQ